MSQPLQQHVFDAGKLIEDYPPQWSGRNKLAVYKIACSSRYPFEGRIVYSRWPEEEAPETIGPWRGRFSSMKGTFAYPASDPHSVAWHMNFADPELFTAYASSLLAQEELLVAEHPVLGSLKEAMDASGEIPLTIGADGRPTPVTITGVQRRCAINTSRSWGNPNGLYGNEFARASEQNVISATKAIRPPTVSHILSMSAPAWGRGAYTADQLSLILNTAFTGFSAARRESSVVAGTACQTVIHTGFWGCGAFGGNRTVMTVLQSLAADLAQVDLDFWSFDSQGVEDAKRAREFYLELVTKTQSTKTFLRELEAARFEWGISDGN